MNWREITADDTHRQYLIYFIGFWMAYLVDCFVTLVNHSRDRNRDSNFV